MNGEPDGWEGSHFSPLCSQGNQAKMFSSKVTSRNWCTGNSCVMAQGWTVPSELRRSDRVWQRQRCPTHLPSTVCAATGQTLTRVTHTTSAQMLIDFSCYFQVKIVFTKTLLSLLRPKCRGILGKSHCAIGLLVLWDAVCNLCGATLPKQHYFKRQGWPV